MVNRAIAAFVFSIIGAVYQIISPYIAVIVDRNTSPFYYTLGYYPLFLTSFVAIWSASHILEEWKGRITWPSIVLALGITNLTTIMLTYYAQTQNSSTTTYSTVPSLAAILAVIPGPLFLSIGGILGFLAVRQYSREHGRAVIGHA
jgi:hypothetical protein